MPEMIEGTTDTCVIQDTDRPQGLRSLYLSGAELKLQRLRAAFSGLNWAKPDARHTQELHHLLHSLAGSAGCYGFPNASRIACEALAYLQEHVLSFPGPFPQAASVLGRSLDRLEACFQEARARELAVPASDAERDPPIGETDVLLLSSTERSAAIARYLQEMYGCASAIAPPGVACAADIRRCRPGVVLLEWDAEPSHVQDWCYRAIAGVGRSGPPLVYVGDSEQRAAALSGGVVVTLPPATSMAEMAGILHRLASRERQTHDDCARDPRSGAYTQAYMRERLEDEMRRARRYGRQFSLTLLALSGSIPFRAQHGAVAADRLLEDFVTFLAERLRASDLVGRASGDRLWALMPETRPLAAANLLRRLRPPLTRDGLPSYPTGRDALVFYAGVAGFPDNGAQAEDLIAECQRALKLGESGESGGIATVERLPESGLHA